MSTIVKAAAVQISPVLYSRDGTIEKVVRKIRELGEQGVQFATFPETIIPTTRIVRSSRPLCRTSWDPSSRNCSIKP